MKIANIYREIPHNFMSDLRNFNASFRKYLIYDNIKSHKNAVFHPLFVEDIVFRKPAGGVGCQTTPQPFKG